MLTIHARKRRGVPRTRSRRPFAGHHRGDPPHGGRADVIVNFSTAAIVLVRSRADRLLPAGSQADIAAHMGSMTTRVLAPTAMTSCSWPCSRTRYDTIIAPLHGDVARRASVPSTMLRLRLHANLDPLPRHGPARAPLPDLVLMGVTGGHLPSARNLAPHCRAGARGGVGNEWA